MTKEFTVSVQNYWCQFRQLDPIVGTNWQPQDQGTKMFKLTQKLKRTKYQIKNWARRFLGNNHHKLVLNAQKIDHLENLLANQPNSPRLNSWLRRILRQREKLLMYNQVLGHTQKKRMAYQWRP